MPRCGRIAASFAAIVSSTIADKPVDADVIVVGAGYAGLSAARDLRAAGLSVRVLEANARPGGRTLNYNLSDVGVGSGIMELGGEWLAPRKDQPHAWQLISDELGYDVVFTGEALAQDEALENLIYTLQHKEGIHVKSDGTGILRALGVKTVAELAWMFEEMTRLKLQLPLGAERLDNMTFETWLQEHRLSADAHELLRSFISLDELYAEASQYSALAGVMTGGGEDFIKALGSAQNYRVKGGLAAPTLAMAAALGHQLHLATPVTAISQDDAGVLVQAQPKDSPSLQVRAKRVLFSGAPPTSLKVDFRPPLPSKKRELFEKLPMGNAVKLQLIYSRPFWKDLGLDGSILNIVDLDNSPGTCMDNSPLDSDLGALLCVVSGNFSESLMRKGEDERKDVIASFLARSFGEEAKRPIHYIDHDWTAEPYIGGACQVVWEPSTLTEYGNHLTADFKMVSWIGTDVSTPINGPQMGFVDGAIKSGREAAQRIILELKEIVAELVVAVV